MLENFLELLNNMISDQEKKLFSLGESLIPNLTSDDILQPMDFLDLEQNPIFRFEEGNLFGLKEVRAALLTFLKEKSF